MSCQVEKFKRNDERVLVKEYSAMSTKCDENDREDSAFASVFGRTFC